MKKILFFLISCLSALTIPLGAQNVTISPSTGNLVAAVTEDQEVGFGGGWSAMWRHEQLPLDFTVSDHADLTDGGEIANPAGNLLVQDGKLLILCGQLYDGYMCLSLPKGYSITGYRLVLANDNVGEQVALFKGGYISKERFLQKLKNMRGITFQYAFCTEASISKLKKL